MGIFTNKITKTKLEIADRYLANSFHLETKKVSDAELAKTPFRYDIINFLIGTFDREITYLEIGVRVPAHNFDKINAHKKYSVDPGIEREHNPVDFPVTSDAFFGSLDAGEILSKDIQFDVIFIDGLHLAEQVEKDIQNSLKYLSDDGFIVMHDCNPPSESHARETFEYLLSPAGSQWNGTTWKAFLKTRMRNDLFSCCVDTDWGVGIISKKINFGLTTTVKNEFYEYEILKNNRKNALNLISFDALKNFF